MRATYLRDGEGKLYLIPNGDIRTLINLTNQWAQVIITFNFDYEIEMKTVLHSLKEAARQIQTAPSISDALIEAPRVLEYTGFTDWAVQSQIIAKTHPGKQWLVGREIRKTALEYLQKEGIRPAIPRQRVETVH